MEESTAAFVSQQKMRRQFNGIIDDSSRGKMAEITAGSIVLMTFDAANIYNYGRFNGSLKFQMKSQEDLLRFGLRFFRFLRFINLKSEKMIKPTHRRRLDSKGSEQSDDF